MKHVERHPRPVLVGITDTPSGWAALEAGIRIARRDGAPLTLVHVWRDVDWYLSAASSDVPQLLRSKHAQQLFFASAYAHTRATAPDLKLAAEFAPGSLYAVLLERSEAARFLVLGTSSTEDGVGSVGAWYLEHSRCPVAVVGSDGTTVAESRGRTSAYSSMHA